MKTARWGVESISIWCPECFEYVPERSTGTLQFTEADVHKLPSTMECGACGAKFRSPTWPAQRMQRSVP